MSLKDFANTFAILKGMSLPNRLQPYTITPTDTPQNRISASLRRLLSTSQTYFRLYPWADR